MTKLAHSHLMTLDLNVDIAGGVSIGQTPAGHRRIVPIEGGTFKGDRMRGAVLPGGADWVIYRSDGEIILDVRLILKTDDDALIYLTYQGCFTVDPEALDRMRKGVLLNPDEYSIVITPHFECADERYRWLNNLITVGTGEQTFSGPKYSIFAIG